MNRILPLILLGAAASAPFLYPVPARAYSFFLEPGLNIEMLQTPSIAGSQLPVTTGAPSYGGELRFGLKNAQLFSSLDIRANFVSLGTDNAVIYGGGVSGGYDFVSVPLRILMGVDLFDNSTGVDGYDGMAFRMGLSYYFSEKVALTLRDVFHFGSVPTSSSQSGTVRFNSLGLSLSFPFDLAEPKGDWRRKNRGAEATDDSDS